MDGRTPWTDTGRTRYKVLYIALDRQQVKRLNVQLEYLFVIRQDSGVWRVDLSARLPHRSHSTGTLVRQPGTLVPKALYVLVVLPRDVFFLSPDYLRAPSADRRETSPRDRNLGEFYNASPKIRGPSPQRNWGPKHAKFGAISDNFRLRSRISPERVKISKIGKRTFSDRFLPRLREKSGELWSTNYRELDVGLDPPKLHFSGDYISAPRGYVLAPQILTRTRDSPRLGSAFP